MDKNFASNLLHIKSVQAPQSDRFLKMRLVQKKIIGILANLCMQVRT